MAVNCHWCKGEYIRFHEWLPDHPKNRWDTVKLCMRCFTEAKTTGRARRSSPPTIPGVTVVEDTLESRTTDVMMGVTLAQMEARRSRWAKLQSYSDN